MEKQQIEKIFNRFCTLVNRDYNEYRIRDKEGFIKAIASNKAGQFVQSSIPEISDEEIEKMTVEYLKNKYYPIARSKSEASKLIMDFIKLFRTRLRELKGENNPVFQKLKDKGLIDESYVAMDKVSEICDKAAKKNEFNFY